MNFRSFEIFYKYLEKYFNSKNIKINCCKDELRLYYNGSCNSFNYNEMTNKILAKDYKTGINYSLFGEGNYFYMLPDINSSGRIDPSVDLEAYAFEPNKAFQTIIIKSGNLIHEIYLMNKDEQFIRLYDATALNYIIEEGDLSYKEIFNLDDYSIVNIGVYPDASENNNNISDRYGVTPRNLLNNFLRKKVKDEEEQNKLLKELNQNIAENNEITKKLMKTIKSNNVINMFK